MIVYLHRRTASVVRLLAILAMLAPVSMADVPGRWEVPLGGNAYLTQPPHGSADQITAAGTGRWQEAGTVFSVYFRVDRGAELDLALRLTVPQGESSMRVSAPGMVSEIKADAGELQEISVGAVSVEHAGYVKVDLQGLRKAGGEFGVVSELVVTSVTPGLKLDYVKEPGGNRFYWGRRGPSVHLGYLLPTGKTVEYFHSEITVPEGQDAVGSYFMANGFGEGYFGMQVNGPDERRILFSVWSPFSTDNPRDIPQDQRVLVLAKGEGVRTGEFGNEGSGGQSFFRFPWKAGTAYRFLTRALPDGQGHTVYTSWFFAPEAKGWKLIASFKRPKTEKHLTGLHSFLENFNDRNGFMGRMALHGNQWARDTGGEWHELTTARFTGDDIAQRGYRMDYAGGVIGKRFFLRNGGFFDEPVALKSEFTREPGPTGPPEIELHELDELVRKAVPSDAAGEAGSR